METFKKVTVSKLPPLLLDSDTAVTKNLNRNFSNTCQLVTDEFAKPIRIRNKNNFLVHTNILMYEKITNDSCDILCKGKEDATFNHLLAWVFIKNHIEEKFNIFESTYLSQRLKEFISLDVENIVNRIDVLVLDYLDEVLNSTLNEAEFKYLTGSSHNYTKIKDMTCQAILDSISLGFYGSGYGKRIGSDKSTKPKSTISERSYNRK